MNFQWRFNLHSQMKILLKRMHHHHPTTSLLFVSVFLHLKRHLQNSYMVLGSTGNPNSITALQAGQLSLAAFLHSEWMSAEKQDIMSRWWAAWLSKNCCLKLVCTFLLAHAAIEENPWLPTIWALVVSVEAKPMNWHFSALYSCCNMDPWTVQLKLAHVTFIFIR